MNHFPEEKHLRPKRFAALQPFIAVVLVVVIALTGSHARAADYSLTGFGTIGYAVSDLKAPYLRYIDKSGTFRADSLIGLQGEAQFDPQWGATVQVVASAPRYKDNGVAAQVRWAFASYRPNNEWLFRVGRFRPPVLMNTQNAEVGLTYEQARLPAELYTLSPVYDMDGAALTKSWQFGASEYAFDGYLGISKLQQRTPYQRDAKQTFVPDKYFPERVRFLGIVVSGTDGPLSFRGGVHRATLMPDLARIFVEDPSPMQINLPPPVGGQLYVPGAIANRVDVNAVTFGVDWQFGQWRALGEYGQRFVMGTKMGPASRNVLLSMSRESGPWTPYVAYSRILSGQETRRYFDALNSTPVPLAVQGPPFLLSSTYHGVFADAIYLYDQYSLMLGASYIVSPNSKLKFEWMSTKIGKRSVLIDGDVHQKRFGVLSISYNFSF